MNQMSERKPNTEVNIPAVGGRGGGGRGPNRFGPKEKAKDVKGTLSKLIKFYLLEGKSLLFAFLLLLADTVISVFVPRLIGLSVDGISNAQTITRFAFVLIGAYVLSGLLNIAQGVIMNFASQRIVRGLRKTLFDKLQKLPLTYHDTHTHGELMSRLTNDVDNISSTIAQSTTQLGSAVIMLTGTLAMMLTLSLPLTGAALITVPFVIILTQIVARVSKKLFSAQQNALGRLNGLIEETIAGQKIVKAFHMESKTIQRFAVTNDELCEAARMAQIRSGVMMPLMSIISNLGYLSVAVFGGIQIIAGNVTVGVVASFLTYSRQFTMPLNNIAGTFTNLQSALAGAERVFEVLAESNEPADVPDAVPMTLPHGDVRFEDVRFAYVPGADILKDINFEVQAGQKIALIGETGAGKTTIVNLLSRFYDVTSGTVFIDGIDIRNYRRDDLRSAFSVVLQDTCLFTGTIADNIRYGRPEATDEEVLEAARVGGAYEFIARLRDGFNTIVSGDSESLSQGQRQLLSISRAVLCKAPILILDEATSSVDTRTERGIQAAMLRLQSGSTSFVIAHRLSTIRDADMIFVMKDGEIVERGDHETLLSLKGVYASMYAAQ
jgi:ATP-binding cassette subfamily B protein